MIEAPLFDLKKPDTVTGWLEKRFKAPGLWAEIAGKYIIITCPSDSVRGMEDPSLLVNYWDDVIKLLQ